MIGVPKNVSALFAMYDLGFLSPSDIRSFALSALKDPIDEDLLQIAICDKEDRDCIAKAADAFFERNGMKVLTKTDLLRIFAAYIAHLIVQGDVEPKVGADLIASATERCPIPEFHELDTFKYASSEMPDRPQDRSLFEKAIMDEASAWVARRELSRQRCE